MGNVFHKGRHSNMRQSEIQFDRFNQYYNVVQYPKNLNYPFDFELYPITHKITQEPRILKRMNFYSLDALNSFIGHLEHAITLKHDNLLSIETYYVQKNEIDGVIASYSVNIIMEHFNHTLKEEIIVNQRKQHISCEKLAYNVLSQMANALSFLQLHNCCHGNISLTNIYVTKDQKYKLCFISEPLYKTEVGLNPNIMSLMDYLAPKLRASLNIAITSGNLPSIIFYDKYKSDIFSLGLILLQLVSGNDIRNLNLPNKEADRMKNIDECQAKVGPRLLETIKLMLLENEAKRPNFTDVKGKVQIQQDEMSDLLGSQRLRRDTFVTNLAKKEPRKSDPKLDQYIEMKTLGDCVGQEWMNKNYRVSIISEDLENSFQSRVSPRNQAGSVAVNDFDEEAIKFLRDRQSHSVDAGNAKKEFVVPRKATHHQIRLQEKLDKRVRGDDGQDVVITKEEELFMPMEGNLKRLIIKLCGKLENVNIAHVIAEVISHQESLEELALTLGNTSLGSQGLVQILQSMAGLEQLRVLFVELRKDEVTVEAVKTLSVVVREKKNLLQFGIDFAGNRFNGDICEELAKMVEGLDGIKSLALNIGGNSIKREGFERISQGLCGLKSLESLVLFMYKNEIDGAESVGVLIENVMKLEKLKSLAIDLSENAIGDDGAGLIVDFAKKNPNVRVSVELLKNSLSENMIEMIGKEAQDNPSIQLKA